MVQKIAVFGGTGTTGQCVVDYALNKGLSVRLLYRTIDTVPDSFKNRVELVQGNVKNISDVENALTGVDGVVVTLGTRNSFDPTTELSEGLTNIVNAMEKLNIRLISVCLSSFLFWEWEKVLEHAKPLTAEHGRMLEILRKSGLDFIAVLPPHIRPIPSGEHKILHDKSPGREVSKFDLARFLVDSLDQPEHYGNVCGIAKTD